MFPATEAKPLGPQNLRFAWHSFGLPAYNWVWDSLKNQNPITCWSIILSPSRILHNFAIKDLYHLPEHFFLTFSDSSSLLSDISKCSGGFLSHGGTPSVQIQVMNTHSFYHDFVLKARFFGDPPCSDNPGWSDARSVSSPIPTCGAVAFAAGRPGGWAMQRRPGIRER